MAMYQWLKGMATRGLVGSIDELEIDPKELAKEGLEGMARMGAQYVLQMALLEEVDEFLGRYRYERSETAQAGYRNGYRSRTLACGSGAVHVEIPKIKGADEPFRIQSIPAYRRTSGKILDVIPLLYAEGLSTRDFERALGPLWKEAGLSKSSISRANKALHEKFKAWSQRDLSQYRVLYLFLDAVHERVRLRSQEKEGVLVAHGILEDGTRVLLGLQLGPRESEANWRALMESLERRGLRPPMFLITDGNPGLIKAMKGFWHGVPRQRCTVHKTRNVLDRVPRKNRERVKRELHKIFHAKDLDSAKKAVKAFLEKYGREYPTACRTLCTDLGDCLAFFKFPEVHWRRIRTSNVIERAFREVRRRTRVVGRFPNETAALALIWASIEEDRLKWRGIRMEKDILKAAQKASSELSKKPIKIKCAQKYLEEN